VGAGLAEDHHAGLAEPPDHRGVPLGPVAGQLGRPGPGDHAGHVDQVLDGNRPAVQRPPDPPGGRLGVPGRRLGPGLVGQHGHERAQPPVQGIDAPQGLLDQLDAGPPAPLPVTHAPDATVPA
jgi:hypothetical protein